MSYMRPPDYLLTQRPWQLPPWSGLLGNAALLNTPPPHIIQLPQIQLALPDFGDFTTTRRFGTRTDIAPPPQLTPPDLKTWLEMQEIKNMPPGLREFYSAWLGAGRYAVITPALDVLARWLRREDPTKGLEEFQRRAEAASYASPWAHTVGQGVGLAGIAGLTAEGLIARGVGASNIERLLSGLRAGAKPAAVGGAVGAAAGATEGVLTGRDPFAEATKYGTIGLLTGLGGVPRERLIAAGLLGSAVGGSTAKEYGVTKGLEAGSTVFLLPAVLPERLGRGVFTGFTADKRLRTELLTAPRVEVQPSQPRVELPSMQDVRMYMLLTRRTFSDVVADMARQAPPDARRDIFTNVVEMALDRLRAGYDREAVLAVLRSVRSKLDPTSRAQFDEVLRQYRLTEVKTATPEYSLTDESAELLNQFLKQRQEPQYALTDEAAQRLNLFLRRVPEYSLTDEAAAALGRFFGPESRRIQLMPLSGPGARRIQLMIRSEPRYVLTDETAVLLNQLFRQEPRYALAYRLEPSAAARQDQRQTYAVAPATTQRTTQQTATTQTGATTTTTDTTATTPGVTLTTTTTTDTSPRDTTTTTQPPDQPPPGTPPPYIPPWMLSLPAYIALPLLAQMGLRLPPPPNPNMPLGTYLRMLRFPALGRQREVYVLI